MNYLIKHLFHCSALLLTMSVSCWANHYMRDWELADGSRLRAALVDYDLITEVVTLDIDGKGIMRHAEDFSLVDQAWLVEYAEHLELMELRLAELPGTSEIYITSGNYPVKLFIYYPSGYKENEPMPSLLIFDPLGKGVNQMLAYAEAGEATGMVIIGTGYFTNQTKDADDALRYAEVLPQLWSMPRLDKERMFLGGTSGGALRAYKLVVDGGYHWAGVYANGGWLGEKPKRHYLSGMRIAMVNGNNDRGANNYVKRDMRLLEAAGNTVALFSFEGAHQLPNFDAQVKSINWLLGKDTVTD